MAVPHGVGAVLQKRKPRNEHKNSLKPEEQFWFQAVFVIHVAEGSRGSIGKMLSYPLCGFREFCSRPVSQNPYFSIWLWNQMGTGSPSDSTKTICS